MDEQESNALAILEAHLTISEGRLYDHISSMFKWLVATLFAANGGGLLSLTKVPVNGGFPYSAWLFAIGLICSILVGISSSLVAMISSRDLTTTRTQIQIATLQGEIDQALRLKLSTPKKASIWIWTPALIGILSFVLFSIGLIMQVGWVN